MTSNRFNKRLFLRVIFPLVIFFFFGIFVPPSIQGGTQVTLSGTQSLGPIAPDAQGRFAFQNVPLRRNSVNTFIVTAIDDFGNKVSQEIKITQLSLESVVVSKVVAEPLPPERVQQLVNDGVIKLDNPENFNVSKFDIVLTIGKEPVPISVPIALPKEENKMGYEIYRLPKDDGLGGGKPRPQEIQIMIFDLPVLGPPETPPPRIPGVIIIEGRIKSLKEFFSIRFLLMNTSGIFTLKDVKAQLEFPNGGLTHTMPADGIVSLGDILPGSGDQPGQVEREFIIRGDEIGIRPVRVNFGGFVAGPGIDENSPIPFNGSAETSVEVKGPPSFKVKVTHPPYVVEEVPYELVVEITNTGETPALYASLELDVGADAQLVTCEVDPFTGTPSCEPIEGPSVRNLGHLLPGKTTRETFTVLPLDTGPISSCMGVADQNITLQVLVGNIGCLTGRFPPQTGVPEGIPTVTVLPSPNTIGVGIDSPVTAFFSEEMNLGTITVGPNGSFRVIDESGQVVQGELRFETINNKTVAIWQVNDGVTNRLAPNSTFTVLLTQDIRDLQGNPISAIWTSQFRTTSPIEDRDPPTLSLSIEPPVNPNSVIPGEIIRIDAYPSDQGTGVERVELRRLDVDTPGALFELIDQKTVFDNMQGPCIFSIDSAKLLPGHTYQFKATAFDKAGNYQDATIGVIMAQTALPPKIQLPDDPSQPILQGISVSLTPVEVSGGVKSVSYYLDNSTSPFATITLPPFQTSLRTLTLPLGPHTVKAVAINGLGQTGEDSYHFTLAENPNMPVVNFLGSANGANYVSGSSFVVRGEASDPVGIESVKFYLDTPTGNPIAMGSAPFIINTTGLSEGTHTIYMIATNLLGVSNDPNDPSSSLQFNVVPLPQGPPPNPPSVTTVSYPVNGQITFSGNSVPGARIDVTNTNLNITLSVFANSVGIFNGGISGDSGHILSFVAYDFKTSQSPSSATTVQVPAPPVLTGIIVSPQNLYFTAVNQYSDILVTANYNDGTSKNVTSKASFSSNNPACASVNSSGRVVAIAHGNATITVSFEGYQAQISVTCYIVSLVNITVEPQTINFISIGQTQQLTVTGHYSDGTSQTITSGLVYTTGNPTIATVNSSGLVSAKGEGNTQINVSKSGVPPVTVSVTVSTAQDPPPTVAILNPANGTQVERHQAISVLVRAQDTIGGVTKIYLEVTGQTIYSDMKQVSPALDVTREFNFAVSGTAQVGGLITITARAEDTSGKMSDPVSINLEVVDKTAPLVVITQPANNTPFNYGDTVNITVSSSDAVGVTQVRYQTTGALTYSGTQNFPAGTLTATANFSFNIPYGVPNPNVQIIAYAQDAAGNERASIPINIILTDADITPPETEVISVANPGSNALTTVTYQVTSGLDDLDYVLLYFRRNGIGTFNRYTDADGGNPEGKYFPQTGNIGTIVFDSTKMGGDGAYEFYTVGVDKAGNIEPAPKDGSGNVVPDQTIAFNAGTVWTVINTPTVIGEGDTTFDDKNLRIIGTTVTINGYHRFRNVELLNGAVLTHTETTMTTEYGINLELWTLTVDSSSSINVDGRGYLGGQGSGDACRGRTIGNALGSTYRSGGSYGGLGGAYDGTPNPVYGNFVMPFDLGSGGSCGSNNYNAGGDGGGRIQIKAINVIADGKISANGLNGSGWQAGSGSGGSIYLIASTLSGNGLISSNGGSNEVGGGGGRIAIHYIDLSTKNANQIQAMGGQGSYRLGGNGTVFLKNISESGGTLVVDGRSPSDPYTTLPIPPGYVFDNIVLRNSARVLVDSPLVVSGTLWVSGGSILTHSLGSEDGLLIQARRVEVDGTSAIDVSAKGYRGGSGSSATCSGVTLGGLAGAQYRSGGTYGGLGGVQDGAGTNLAYGHPAEPFYLGSGGSCGSNNYNAGGHGGGLVRIRATEAVVVDGSIKADGGTGTGWQAGSGSGGSIFIETSLLTGTGTISANGGAYEVGGGGGRIAIFYDYLGDPADFGSLRQITAFGGHGSSRWGSAGTVLLRRSDQAYGDLYIDDNVASATSSVYTPLTPIGFGRVVALTEDTITTDGVVKMVPNGLRGLEINPNLAQTQTYRVVSNTENTITVDVAGKPYLTNIAKVGDTYAGVYRFDNVYFRRGGYLVMGDPLVVTGTMRIDEYGKLTHYDATLNFESMLDLTVGNLVITSTGSINVDGRGYVGGQGSGDACRGHTIGNTLGSSYRSGGSYGGLGGAYGGTPNPVYGGLTDPAGLGSGGSCGSNNYNAGGDGGGWIEIKVNSIVVDGLITANGANGTGWQAGSGSGGTVYINTSSISGTGTITANGGAYEVGGGGGRIAIHYDNSTFTGQIIASGGDGSYADGQNGTVFMGKK